MKLKSSRRGFLALSAGLFLPRRMLFGQTVQGALPSKQLRVALIGCGWMGGSAARDLMRVGVTIVALCDVDDEAIARTIKELKLSPSIPSFKDWRELLAKNGREFDAVSIATQDHMHAIIAADCMLHGKHCYIQKPLARTVGECEKLMELQRKTGVVCQMGNQGHPGVFRYEALLAKRNPWGEITRIESWSDRPGTGKKPWWDQGMKKFPAAKPAPKQFGEKGWDLFCGVSPNRGFNWQYRWAWRGWWDFGCGAIGDMAVHNADPAFWTFKLGLPVSVKADTLGTGPCGIAHPKQSIIEMEFAPQKLFPKGVTFTWRDGGLLPERVKGMDSRLQYPDNGLLVCGSEATTLGGSHAATPSVIALNGHEWGEESKALQRECLKIVKKVGWVNHYEQWVKASIAGTPEVCGSKLSVSAPFTEALLVGCVGLQFPGEKLLFDPKKLQFTNKPEANKFLALPGRGEYDFAKIGPA